MKLKTTLVAFTALSSAAFAQNVGIGYTGPASKLSINGGLSVGQNILAPTGGALIAGRVGIGMSTTPGNKLELNSGVANSSGFRFTQMKSTTPATAGASVLGIDANGDVVVATPGTGVVADNGLTVGYNTAGHVGLGGTLAKNTDVDLNGKYLNFAGADTVGRVGIGLPVGFTPGNKLEINSSVGNTSGLRLRNLTNGSPVTTGASAIGVDANGDVVKVSEPLRVIGGTIGGSFPANGGYSGTGWTATLNNGYYTVTFTTPLSAVYGVSATVYDPSNSLFTNDNAQVNAIGTNQITLETGASDGSPSNRGITFVVIGK